MSNFLGSNNVLLVNLRTISIDFNFLSNTVESFQIVGVDYPFHYFHMSTDRKFLKVDKNLVEKGGKGCFDCTCMMYHILEYGIN